MTDSLNKHIKLQEKITWSNERKKWLCYDNNLIDVVLNSNNFIVPTYDYTHLEKKISRNFEHTKQVIEHFPLSNDGEAHFHLRKKMHSDINLNLKNAIQVFIDCFESKISSINNSNGVINLAPLLINSILKSNLIFTGVELDDNFDYSDLTLMLDDTQSIKSRVAREEFIKSISEEIYYDDKFYKLALMSVGVNALISSTLHSVIKVLLNNDFKSLIKRKHFVSNGIKHLERICIQETILNERKINSGEKIRLYVECYENANLPDLQMNKKFFASESQHSCIGMNYSLTIWKEMINIISTQFSDMHLISYDYRSNDGIFNFPTNVYIEYSK